MTIRMYIWRAAEVFVLQVLHLSLQFTSTLCPYASKSMLMELWRELKLKTCNKHAFWTLLIHKTSVCCGITHNLSLWLQLQLVTRPVNTIPKRCQSELFWKPLMRNWNSALCFNNIIASQSLGCACDTLFSWLLSLNCKTAIKWVWDSSCSCHGSVSRHHSQTQNTLPDTVRNICYLDYFVTVSRFRLSFLFFMFSILRLEKQFRFVFAQVLDQVISGSWIMVWLFNIAKHCCI